MLKKTKYFLLVVTSIIIGLFLYKNCNGKEQIIPISYNKEYIEKLDDFEDSDTKAFLKKHNKVFRKVGALEDSLAEVYNLTGKNGVGWSNEGGEVKRIKIKLKNGHEVVYDNSEGGWLDIDKKDQYSESISEFIKISEQPKRIKKHPYGITLDMEGEDQLLILFGHSYATDPARLLTMIYIGADNAEIIFNKHFDLFEIREDESGYSLIGRLGSEGSYSDPYEIAIEDGKLTMKKLPLQKVYESQDPHIIFYDAIGYGYNKQPGEFTRIEIIASQEGKHKENEVVNIDPYDTWTPFPMDVKLPSHTTTIKRTPYFIVLESTVGRMVLLSRRDYKEQAPSVLTIQRIYPFYPIPDYDNYFRLQEITEDEVSFYLLGTREDAEARDKIYEITIDKATMEYKLNW